MREEFYKRVIYNSPIGYAYHKIVCDSKGNPCDYEYIEINNAFEKYTGFKAEDIIGKRISEVLPQIYESEFNWVGIYGNIALNGGEEEYEQYFEPFGKWYKIQVYSPEKYYFITSIIEITKQKLLHEKLESSERMLWNVMDTIPTRIFWKGLDFKYLGCSKSFARDAGFSSSKEVIGKDDYEMSWRKLADIYHKEDQYVFETGCSMLDYEQCLINSDGETRFLRTSKIPLYDNNNNIYGMMGIYEDITERKKSEELLKESQLRYEQLAEASRSVAWEVDKKGMYTYISPVCEKVFGYKPEEVIGKMYFYDLAMEEDREEIMEHGYAVLKQKGILSDYEYRIKNKSNKVIWLLSNGFPILDEHGEVSAFRGIDIDITYLKEIEDKIRYLSFHDQLTGLYNRRFFEEELKRLDTERNLPLSLAMIDVNGLKLVNDAFGHKSGDRMLKKVGQIIKKECRTDDIIARIGGDEFVILLPKTNYSDAVIILDRIHKAVEKENIEAINLSISYGCDTKRKKSESMEDVFKIAETNMYKLKTSQRTNLRRETIKIILEKLFHEIPLEEMHSNGVSQISVSIGKALGLNELELNKLKMSGLLHDIGKIAIDKDIIIKIELLEESERTEIKRHPEVSYSILSSSNEYSIFAEDVLYHHERYDGNGYPKGLKGEEIPLNSRIIAVADAYDSMTNDRPYRKAKEKSEVIKILKEEAGKQFDPRIVKVFLDKVIGE